MKPNVRYLDLTTPEPTETFSWVVLLGQWLGAVMLSGMIFAGLILILA